MTRLRIATFARVAAAALAMFATTVSWGFATQPQAYTAPPFATLIGIMPTTGWSVAWGVVAVLLAVAAIFRLGVAWIAGVVVAVALAACWIAGLAWAHWVHHSPLSPSGFALWCWFVASQMMLVSSPRQFVQATR